MSTVKICKKTTGASSSQEISTLWRSPPKSACCAEEERKAAPGITSARSTDIVAEVVIISVVINFCSAVEHPWQRQQYKESPHIMSQGNWNGPRRRPAQLLLVRRAFSSWVALQSSSFFWNYQFLHLVCAGRAMKKFALQKRKTDLSQVLHIYLGEKHCLGWVVAPWWQAAPRNAVALSSTL